MSTIRIPMSAPKLFTAIMANLVADGVLFNARIDGGHEEFVITLTGGF